MSGRTLLLTVGTGNTEDVENSLLNPLRKSMAEGGWDTIVLLPSQETVGTAARLRDEGVEGLIVVNPLPDKGDEYDPDRCFVHFDQVLADLLHQGRHPRDITADITRGTKAMSAALALAATRHEVPTLRYVTGDQRDVRHMVVPGTEAIHDGTTLQLSVRRRLDAARRLMQHGGFAGVETLLDGDDGAMPADLAAWVQAARALAECYSAWDRLDFDAAAGLAEIAAAMTPPPGWDALAVDAAAVAWLRDIASVDAGCEAGMRADDRPAFAAHLGRLCAEIIANGRRRVIQQQFEDAAIRAYRCTELIGQARLFTLGHDSERMSVENPVIAKFVKEKRKDSALKPNRDGTYPFGREWVARVLRRLGDPLGDALFDFGKEDAVKARNLSLLIHGFRATGPKDSAILVDQFSRLEGFLRQAFGEDAGRWLDLAARVPPAGPAVPAP
ncbi:MAG: TIGR02710 family CRISPR-associated CARF protein [Pseudomonadota bacterium]|nr:TIGR02710 family CRISPR-associated CARF protein [Pseudomonadota bacterium]